MSADRSLLKRETLIRNLKKVVEKIPTLDLPATIMAIYAFGGMLREKERLHDFDIVVLYSMTPEQQVRWKKFCSNFSTVDLNHEQRQPLDELREHFAPFLKRGIPLSEAVKDETLAKVLRARAIVPDWAGCFSWTDLYFPFIGIFSPSIETVIRRVLLGKRVRGLQVIVRKYDEFTKGNTLMVAKNYKLVWSPDRSDIEKNLEYRTLGQKTKYLNKEINHFLNEEIPRLRKEYEEARNKVIEANTKVGAKLDVYSLDKQHLEIQVTDAECYEELRDKCEKARSEMRKYREETIVLHALVNALEYWLQVKNNPYFINHGAENCIALWAIRGVRKEEVKEERVREILRTLKLPEDHVITLKRYQMRTEYMLWKNKQEREVLLKRVRLENLRTKLSKAIAKEVKSIDRQAHIFLEVTDEGKPRHLEIWVHKSVDEHNEVEKQAIKSEFIAKGFKVEDWASEITCIKQINLNGNETIEELKTTAKGMIMPDPHKS